MKLLALALLLATLASVSGCQPEPRPEPEPAPERVAPVVDQLPPGAEPSGTLEYPAPCGDEQAARDAGRRRAHVITRTGDRTFALWRISRVAPCPDVPPEVPTRGLVPRGRVGPRYAAVRFELVGPWSGRTVKPGVLGGLLVDPTGKEEPRLLCVRLVALGPPRASVVDQPADPGDLPRRHVSVTFPVDLIAWDGRTGELWDRVTWLQYDGRLLRDDRAVRDARGARRWEEEAQALIGELERAVVGDALGAALDRVERSFGPPRRY